MRYTNFAAVAALLLALASAAPDPQTVHAQVKKVTAGEVVDKESLREFVTWATSVFAAVTDINEGTKLIQEFRTEGSDWNVGNMYLILFAQEGQVFLHGEDPNIDGKNAWEVVDDNGTKVVQQIIAAGAAGGGFVEWCWDDPNDPADSRCKDSYAIKYRSLVAGADFTVVGGYYQDLTHVGEPLPSIPLPAVSAADVVDRETLKAFVQGSFDWLFELIGQVGFERANEWKALLREEGGHFRSDPVYLFMFTAEGYVLFHGANPSREGRFAQDNIDVNGVRFVELLIQEARAGGGFVEYFWDDPTVDGDEDTGSPKVSYALSYKNDLDVFQGQEFILGAGFYRNFSTAEAESAAEDWLHRVGRSVASQAMEMIGDRVSNPYRSDNYVEVGGQSVDFGALAGSNALGIGLAPRLESWIRGAGSSPGRPLSIDGLLGGSSFQLSDEDGGYSLWGGGEMTRFSGPEAGGVSDGEVLTAALGADYAMGSLVTGLAVTHSRASGEFELGRAGDDDRGELSTTLTSAFPYARMAFGDRLSTWGLLGYGAGDLGVEGSGEKEPNSDVTMQMGGLGMKAALVNPESALAFELAVRSDAFLARMTSKEVEGRRELTADASRVRLMLEGSTGFAMGSGTLRPRGSVSVRYDGGEVDAGFGLEVGGGVTFVNPDQGLTIRVHGRGLIVHQESDFEEWGIGGSLTLNPGGGGQGLSLGLRPSWGSTMSDATRLWAHGATALGPGGAGGYGTATRGLDAEVGYGVEAMEGRGIFTPYARLVLRERLDAAWFNAAGGAGHFGPMPVGVSNRGIHGYQLGGRLHLAPGLVASIEAGRSALAPESGAAHLAAMNLSLRW